MPQAGGEPAEEEPGPSHPARGPGAAGNGAAADPAGEKRKREDPAGPSGSGGAGAGAGAGAGPAAKKKKPGLSLEKLRQAKAKLQKQKGLTQKLREARALKQAAAPAAEGQPPPLRLDAQGREVDAAGNPVERKVVATTTFKVNVGGGAAPAAAPAREKAPAGPPEPPAASAPEADPRFLDPRMGASKAGRRDRRAGFSFVQRGTFQAQALQQRLRARLGGEIKQEDVDKVKGMGEGNPNLIKLGERLDNKVKLEEPPALEWWDRPFTTAESYAAMGPDCGAKVDKINLYVEHPVPIEPAWEAAAAAPQALRLTKKEQKKLRKQRREAREKEKQEMIRQGLLAAPAPKVKISNLARVLSETAAADPTKIEQEVREQMAERQQAHEDRNLARKLTPAEQKEKKMKKLFGAPGAAGETRVAVFKIGHMANPAIKFKVEVNAQQNNLTGCALVYDDFTTVVVEGVTKAVNRYKKLMLNRIDWDALYEAQDSMPQKANFCALVWEGAVRKANFRRFTTETRHNELAARKYLHDFGVAHYWDLAKSAGEG